MAGLSEAECNELAAAFPVGMQVQGTIVHHAPFGVFIWLDESPTTTVLLEAILIADFRRSSYPNDFPLGSRIEARVAGCTPEGELRLTQLNEWQVSPHEFSQEKWNDLVRSYPAGTKVWGRVRRSTSFGVFVELDNLPFVYGLILLPAMFNYASLRYPEDFPAAGSRIEAVIVEWVEHSWNLSLAQVSPEHSGSNS